jgi:hypothetical protein
MANTMREYANAHKSCITKCQSLYLELDYLLSNEGFIFKRVPNMYLFRLFWVGSRISISISYPPDANMYSEVIETALFVGGDIVYNNTLLYNDVRRFESVGELVEELRRVRRIVGTKDLSEIVDCAELAWDEEKKDDEVVWIECVPNNVDSGPPGGAPF